jgi:uncharacterized protein YjbJ (UPF0337 family)
MNSTPSSGKVEGLIGEASGRITGDSGQEATGRARQGLADASRTATETLRDAADIADDVRARGLVRMIAPLEHMPPSVYLAAMLGSILFSLMLYLTGRRWAGIFVGLWAPTFLNVGMYLKQLQPSRAG